MPASDASYAIMLRHDGRHFPLIFCSRCKWARPGENPHTAQAHKLLDFIDGVARKWQMPHAPPPPGPSGHLKVQSLGGKIKKKKGEKERVRALSRFKRRHAATVLLNRINLCWCPSLRNQPPVQRKQIKPKLQASLVNTFSKGLKVILSAKVAPAASIEGRANRGRLRMMSSMWKTVTTNYT